jgi:hypothetical protein
MIWSAASALAPKMKKSALLSQFRQMAKPYKSQTLHSDADNAHQPTRLQVTEDSEADPTLADHRRNPGGTRGRVLMNHTARANIAMTGGIAPVG